MGSAATRVNDAAQRFANRAITPRLTSSTWREQAGFVAATIALLVFMVRVLAAGWSGQFPIFFPDSFSFLNVANLTPFSPAFYAAERPIAYPTLLFLLGRSTLVTVFVQTFLYGLAYLFVAVTMCRLLRSNEARVIGVVLVLSMAIEPRFALWNTHILSESLGMTLAAVSVVAWWRFSADPSKRLLNWAGLATLGWLTVRDSNVPPWFVVGVPALFIASFAWRSAAPELRRALRVWSIVTLLVCIGVTAAQSANGRNRYATMNNVGLRVLPNREMTQWFEDQGMPVDNALLARTNSSSFDNSWDMLRSADLADFRAWADSSGQRTMLLSYARFAPHWLHELYDDLPILLAADHSAYDRFGVSNRLPDAPPGQIAGPTTRRGLLVWTLIAAAGLALAALRRRGVQATVLALLLVSSFVDLYMAYVGDSVEVQRHMVGPLSRMTLIMLICLSVGVDCLVELLRRPRSRVAGQAEGDDELRVEVDEPDDEVASTHVTAQREVAH
jgi:hypothetical protein